MFKSSGTLIYDPHEGNERILKSQPWWLILKTGEGIIQYYKHWIQKHHYDCLKFDKTIWGSHISVNRGEMPLHKKHWNKYAGRRISFTYTNNIYRVNEIFFCVDVQSPALERIRLELGLAEQPKYGFHLTIGRLNKEQLEKQAAKIN